MERQLREEEMTLCNIIIDEMRKNKLAMESLKRIYHVIAELYYRDALVK